MEPRNLWTHFDGNVRQLPDKPAIIYLGTAFSYRKVKEYAETLASGLCKLGIGRDDRVVIYAPNTP